MRERGSDPFTTELLLRYFGAQRQPVRDYIDCDSRRYDDSPYGSRDYTVVIQFMNDISQFDHICSEVVGPGFYQAAYFIT